MRRINKTLTISSGDSSFLFAFILVSLRLLEFALNGPGDGVVSVLGCLVLGHDAKEEGHALTEVVTTQAMSHCALAGQAEVRQGLVLNV